MGSLKCTMSCVSWNVQSIRNKCPKVLEHIIDQDADVVFLSETWMEADNNDITALIKDSGYKLLHNRRKDRDKEVGGGVGVMVKSSTICKQQNCKSFSSFEHTMVKIKLTNNTHMILITIYRLLYVAPNIFLDEFTEMLEILSVMHENFVLSGDINFHLETDENYVSGLKDIFTMFNLVQYVNVPTHKHGHTLDLILAQNDGPKISSVKCTNVELSDHFMLTFQVEASVSEYAIKTITYRNFGRVNCDRFKAEVTEAYGGITGSTLAEKVTNYNKVMKELVDKHAPLKTKNIKIVPNSPWFDNEYRDLRTLRRKAEKKYKRSKTAVDRETFVNLRKQTTELAFRKKRDYYRNEINDCEGKTKMLFKCVNRLLDVKQDSVLPTHDSSVELANKFQTYFKEKIDIIRNQFPTSSEHTSNNIDTFTGTILETFEPATEDEIRSIIMEYGIKCSPEDPVPAKLLKNCYETFIPIWHDLVNLSLSQGSMDFLKSAVLRPLIKEMDSLMDSDVYKNYRPVSNLEILGKLIERVVGSRMDSHMDTNNLHSRKQYAYKRLHSTEMLLAKIVDELLLSCDKKKITLLLFLDLSAAFDTVDQRKLLNILSDEIGVRGTALKWFESFLLGRTQKVKIGDAYSVENMLDYGVPQGSILGPKLFNIYTRSFPIAMQNIGYSAEGFADDQQLRKQFNLLFQIDALGENLDDCFQVIDSWMIEYFLKLNAGKTKIMVVAPPSLRKKVVINGTFINGKCVRFVDRAKNLGVLFDDVLCFDAQINKVVSTCFGWIRSLSRIKYFLSTEELKTLVSSLIFSTLDYCNALYYGLTAENIKKLQRVQNSAARLVFKINCFDRRNSDELFEELHWLKVRERIVFKILLIVHKCVNDAAPEDMRDLFRFNRSDRMKKLETKRCYGMMGDRAFSVAGPKLWNALPLRIRKETCTDTFKKSLKTYLFTNAELFYNLVHMK